MELKLRLTRKGCLAVHLMPKYTGKKLEDAIERIMRRGPRNKHEIQAVWLANAEEFSDKLIPY